MTISQRDKAQKELLSLIDGELSTLLRSPAQMHGHPLSQQDVSELSLCLATRIISNQALLEKVGEFVPRKEQEWLTTEQAARRSGFSRPFIAALLDGPLFSGRVSRTAKGHRRVAAVDFQQWMAQNRRPADLPVKLSDLRSGPRNDKPTPLLESANEERERIAARDGALRLARGMGLG